MLLSDRMRAVAGLVQPCRSIADIGCDHGYVAVELVRRKICGHVIAMDINKGPLERAEHTIREHKLQDFIETRLSDGMEALAAGEAEGIICAGMGGKLIISILGQGMEMKVDMVRNMKQIILQPQSELAQVRRYLRENGFCIEKEDMVCEDGKFYSMMRVLPGTSGKTEPQDDMIQLIRVQDTYGPCLLDRSHPVLKRYLLSRKENLGSIREKIMGQGQATPRQQNRITQLDEELGDVAFCLHYYYGVPGRS